MASSWGSSWGTSWGSSWGGTSGPVLPNKGPFQCGLFQPNVFQNDCTTSTGTGPQGGGWEPGGRYSGEFRQRVGGEDFFLRPLPQQIERAIESVVREATSAEAPVVLEAKVERAGFDWDAAYLQIVQEMQRRDVATLAALRTEIAGELAAQRLIEQGRVDAIALQARRDNDAIALLLLLH